MADLDAKQRNKLPGKDFAGPDRSFPVEDRSHAANAKARASQMFKAGKLSEGQKARVDAKADAVLKQ